MSLTPDDLPPADDGMQQMVCACLNETFHVVLADGGATVKAICARCKAVNAAWSGFDWGPGLDTSQMLPGGGERDMLNVQQRATSQVVSGADWVGDPADPEPLRPDAELPELPVTSPEVANAVLEGGHYDTRLVFIPDDVTTFQIRGYSEGLYRRTSTMRGGRTVYALTPFPGDFNG
jgi:hypothetical protein